MIRAVIDTNIIVSALFWGGLPRAVLDAARTKRFRMLTTEEMMAELRDVLARAKFADRLAQIGETVDSFIEDDYRALVEVVEAAKLERVTIADPDDDALIRCAMGGAADYIVSGDHHLLDLGDVHNIKIWSVKRFLEEALAS